MTGRLVVREFRPSVPSADGGAATVAGLAGREPRAGTVGADAWSGPAVGFEVAPGEVWCLTGRSGSGKSLLVSALYGLLPWASGEVTLPSGRRAGAADRWQPGWAEVALVPQSMALAPYLLVGDVLALALPPDGDERGTRAAVGRRGRGHRRGDAPDTPAVRGGAGRTFMRADARDRSGSAERPGAAAGFAPVRAYVGAGPEGEVIDRLGLRPLLARRCAALSLGQQQRVAVARAALARPQVVLADEPTSHQDAAHAAAVLDVLAACGAAVVLGIHVPPTHPAVVGATALERVES